MFGNATQKMAVRLRKQMLAIHAIWSDYWYQTKMQNAHLIELSAEACDQLHWISIKSIECN